MEGSGHGIGGGQKGQDQWLRATGGAGGADGGGGGSALWARIIKNPDHSLVCSHHSLILLLNPACVACPLCCAHSLAHFAHSLIRGTVNDWMAINSVFFPILDHSAVAAMVLSGL